MKLDGNKCQVGMRFEWFKRQFKNKYGQRLAYLTFYVNFLQRTYFRSN